LGEVELLALRADMVKLKSAQPSRVAAEDTCAAGLLDRLSLNGSAEPANRRGPAALATVVAAALEDELALAVSLTVEDGGPAIRVGRETRTDVRTS
jgi:hypothetical protein